MTIYFPPIISHLKMLRDQKDIVNSKYDTIFYVNIPSFFSAYTPIPAQWRKR